MFELILNATRLALSDEAKRNATALLDQIRRTPEWQRDICSIQASIQKAHAEQATLLCGLTASKMENLRYPLPAILAFKTCYHEIFVNAFEHACRSIKENVTTTIAVTPEYVSVVVENPLKRQFSLPNSLEQAKERLRINPMEKRGRGLIVVSDLADSFASLPSENAVKAVFYKDWVELRIRTFPSLAIFKIVNGLHNPSFQRKLSAAVLKFLDCDVVIDFTNCTAGTSCVSIVIELHEFFSKSSRHLLAIQPSSSEVHLPAVLCVKTWQEALFKITRTEHLKVIEKEFLTESELRRERFYRQGNL